ncbi:hypothetical protein A4A49_56489, partial [Nicotiana attenuata]
PKLNIYKLNTDGSNSSYLDKNGIGGVIRNHNGDWVLEFCDNIPTQSILSTEMYALLQGLTLARLHNLIPIQVKIDAKEVITILCNDNLPFANLSHDRRHLLGMLHDPQLTHAYREQNRLADKLASLGSLLEGTNDIVVLHNPPPFVEQILEEDKLGLPRFRLTP